MEKTSPPQSGTQDASRLRYRVYDMTIASDFTLPSLMRDETGDPPVATITRGLGEGGTFRSVDQGVLWKTAPENFEIKVPDVATMRVSSGSRISVDPTPQARPDLLETLILGTGLSVLGQQRGLMPIHASGVQTASGAVLLAGGSGSGKSFLAGALMGCGFPMIADDIAMIRASEEGVFVLPAWDTAKQMPDALAHLAHGGPNLLADTGKRTVRADLFCAQSQPLHQVIFLGWTPDTEITLEEVSGADAWSRLASTVYRRSFLKGMGLFAQNFATIAKVGQSCRCLFLHRPYGLDRTQEVTQMLIARMQAL